MTESGQKWFEQHMEEFVRPYLGSIPRIDPANSYVQSLDRRRRLALKGLWNQAKKLAKGRTILLPGRDVFLFEILARMEGYPTVFRQDLSSSVAPNIPQSEKDSYKDLFCIDTGYKGSVPKALGVENWCLISYNGPYIPPDSKNLAELKAKQKEDKDRWQLFPRQRSTSIIVGMSGQLEGCYKYWNRAEWHYPPDIKADPKTGKWPVEKGHIVQDLSGKTIFKLAAELTQHIVGMEYHSRPLYMFASMLKQTYFDWLPTGARERLSEGLHLGRRDRAMAPYGNSTGTLITSIDTSNLSISSG